MSSRPEPAVGLQELDVVHDGDAVVFSGDDDGERLRATNAVSLKLS
jgi:hypothetical protein